MNGDTSRRTPGDPRAVPDCRTCGACCWGDELWVHVTRSDEERLGDDAFRRLTVLTEQGRGYRSRGMRMERGRCVAFRDQLPDGGGCGCSVYEIRPAICGEFDAGSDDCFAARERRRI